MGCGDDVPRAARDAARRTGSVVDPAGRSRGRGPGDQGRDRRHVRALLDELGRRDPRARRNSLRTALSPHRFPQAASRRRHTLHMRVKTPGHFSVSSTRHTTWSDGSLTLAELVDLYGRARVRRPRRHGPRAPATIRGRGESRGGLDRRRATTPPTSTPSRRGRASTDALRPPRRAWAGADLQRSRSGHRRARGRHRPPLVRLAGQRPAEAMATRARGWGGDRRRTSARRPVRSAIPERTTRRFWHEWQVLGGLVDRYELFNRNEVFSWVADEALPTVACGRLPRLEHLTTWKTLLPCEKSEAAVVDYLRSCAPRVHHTARPACARRSRRREPRRTASQRRS